MEWVPQIEGSGFLDAVDDVKAQTERYSRLTRGYMARQDLAE